MQQNPTKNRVLGADYMQTEAAPKSTPAKSKPKSRTTKTVEYILIGIGVWWAVKSLG